MAGPLSLPLVSVTPQLLRVFDLVVGGRFRWSVVFAVSFCSCVGALAEGTVMMEGACNVLMDGA